MRTETFQIQGPTGEIENIPLKVYADDIYSALYSPDTIKDFYKENGYVVIRNVIPKELCTEAVETFLSEVKPYDGFIYRQASASLEKHKFTDGGHMLNSILNVQSLNPTKLKKFREIGIKILTHKKLQEALSVIFSEAPKLTQSMFFDGNPVTWAHQDTYYLDSENFNMAGVWLAMEDIAPDAGRFYVYPTSQKIDLKKNGGDFDIAFNHERYKQLIIKIIKENNLRISAPALKQGDILIWHGKTIHGCLPTLDLSKSRKSFTGHFIPDSERFLQFQSRIKPLELEKINGMNVNFPKDLRKTKNKLLYQAEVMFPKSFSKFKKYMIKKVTK